MDAPKDCRSCNCSEGCRSYYGGSLCKHTEEINRAAIARILKEEKP
jgi:hypothetical protein